MESLSICNGSPHPLSECCFTPHRNHVSGVVNFQRSSDNSHLLKPWTNHAKLFAFPIQGVQRRSLSQLVKATESEVQTQASAPQQSEGNAIEDTIAEAASQVSSAVSPDLSSKEGESSGSFWSLRSASESEKTHKITSGDGILVGAAPEGEGSPLVLDIPTVSRTHARVYSKEKKSTQATTHECFVMDLGSTNGTYVNRSKLRPQTEVKLSSGDTIKFGDERAVFTVESQS